VSIDRTERRRKDPELAARQDRYVRDLGASPEDADVLTGSRALSDIFEEALTEHRDAPAVASWVVNDLKGVLAGRDVAELPFTGAALGRLAGLVAEGRVSRRAAKDVLAEMARHGGDPVEIVTRLGLEKRSATRELAPAVDQVIAAWPDKVAEYRTGKKNLIGFFVGEVMKGTGGAGDPTAVRTLLTHRLDRA
jgi:Asp-tRNA(Asn)/Glu-tRNA(Gln) amidotransferase B subunit